jgi:hypothetical protein
VVVVGGIPGCRINSCWKMAREREKMQEIRGTDIRVKQFSEEIELENNPAHPPLGEDLIFLEAHLKMFFFPCLFILSCKKIFYSQIIFFLCRFLFISQSILKNVEEVIFLPFNLTQEYFLRREEVIVAF